MAYIDQHKKASMAPRIREILSRYGVKGSIALRNHSTLVLNVKSGDVDFAAQRNPNPDGSALKDITCGSQINPYWYQTQFTDTALAFLQELIPAMNDGNHDRSDVQSDYFDIGWYISINLGSWDKAYVLTK
jgi:hypothetical protein